MDRGPANYLQNLCVSRNSHFLGPSSSPRRRGQSPSFSPYSILLQYTERSCSDEQMIFWGYLIRAIRNPNNACAAAPRVWIKAPCFRFWIAISVSTGLLLFGATSIEIKDLDAQRVRLFPPHDRYELTNSHTSTSSPLVFLWCKLLGPEYTLELMIVYHLDHSPWQSTSPDSLIV
jgi:hypothetical protein